MRQWCQRLVKRGERAICIRVRGKRGETAASVAPIGIIRRSGQRSTIPSRLGKVRPEYGECRRVAVWQTLEEHRVNQTENRNGGSDTKSENQHGEESEPRTAAKQTNPVGKIAKKGAHGA